MGGSITTQLTLSQTLDTLEARKAGAASLAHPPAVFQSADDYGEETVELETACRILADSCSYELQSTIENRKAILSKVWNQR